MRTGRPEEGVADKLIIGDGGFVQPHFQVIREGLELGTFFQLREFMEAAVESALVQCEGAGLVFLPELGGVGEELGVGFEGVAVVCGAVDFDAHEGEDVVREVLADAGEVFFDGDVEG